MKFKIKSKFRCIKIGESIQELKLQSHGLPGMAAESLRSCTEGESYLFDAEVIRDHCHKYPLSLDTTTYNICQSAEPLVSRYVQNSTFSSLAELPHHDRCRFLNADPLDATTGIPYPCFFINHGLYRTIREYGIIRTTHCFY